MEEDRNLRGQYQRYRKNAIWGLKAMAGGAIGFAAFQYLNSNHQFPQFLDCLFTGGKWYSACYAIGGAAVAGLNAIAMGHIKRRLKKETIEDLSGNREI